MTRAFSFLARRRWAGVGLALLVEAVILLPLAFADPSAVVGIPAAVAAAIAGTVAVVFGPLDGALVAFVGAVVFGSVGGWEAGELAALGVWPGIVVAAGLFGRRVARQRRAMTDFLTAQESERERIALELHDETAQALAGALLALRQTELAATADEAGAAHETTRELIQQTIKSIRELAVDLRPKALDDFGLSPAVERLAATFAERTGTDVAVDVNTGSERLPRDIELTIYRAVQEVLAHLVSVDGSGSVWIGIERTAGDVRALIEHDYPTGNDGVSAGARSSGLESLRERVRLAGGRLVARSGGAGAMVRIDLPVRPDS